MKNRTKKNNTEEIAGLYSQWINESEIAYSPHTIRSYETTFSIYIQYLAANGITYRNFSAEECFSKDTILAWLNYLKDEKGCSPETCNLRLSNFRTFLKYIADAKPKYASLYAQAENIKRMRCVMKKQHAISDDVMDLIMETPDAETKSGCVDIVMVSFLYGTAMRVGEMLMVQLHDLHLDDKVPYVHVVGKGNKERAVYVPEKTVENIKDYIAIFHGKNPDPDAFLFYSRVKGKYTAMTASAIDKRLKKLEQKIKERNPAIECHLHAHAFRRTRATNLSDDGLNPFQVSKILGHANLETTMRYVDVSVSKKEYLLMTLENDAEKEVSPLWKGKERKLEDLFKRKKEYE